MKYFMSMLAVVIVSFLFGCQDNNVTGPIRPSELASSSLERTLPVHYIIQLRDDLLVPGIQKSYMNVIGELVISVNELPTECVWTHYDVRVLALVELKPMDRSEPIWTINSVTNDHVLFEVEGQLTKSYTIPGRRDGLALQITLLISREQVRLGGMQLASHNLALVAVQ